MLFIATYTIPLLYFKIADIGWFKIYIIRSQYIIISRYLGYSPLYCPTYITDLQCPPPPNNMRALVGIVYISYTQFIQ